MTHPTPDTDTQASTPNSAIATPNSSQKTAVDNDQNAQARLVLIQLQWLITILLVTAMLWLGNNQSKLAQSVNDRLEVADELNARMNDLDDRLFAVSPSVPMPQSDRSADNDWQLISVQLASANRLHELGNYGESYALLKLVLWQLSHEKLNLATPLKTTLTQSIKDDLITLENLQNSSDLWQLQALKMQEIQRFLRTQMSSDDTLDKSELMLQNAHSSLALAIGASQLHQKRTIAHYLSETLHHLEWLQKHSTTVAKDSSTLGAVHNALPQDKIETIDEAILAINELLANPPTSTPLISVQILKR